MTRRYDPPETGAEDWHIPLNEIFADLEIEVLDEVETVEDLPPTGEESSNGITRRIYIHDQQTIYRDTDGSWEPVAGVGANATRLIESPNLHVQYSELRDDAAIRQPVSVADGQTLTVYSWGASDTDGETPDALEVKLVTPDGTVTAKANTAWEASEDGVAEWENNTGSRGDALLAIHNRTGGDYTDPNGVGGQFGYEVE